MDNSGGREAISTGQLARILGCSTEWVRKQIRRGRIRVTSLPSAQERIHYRIPVEEVDRLLVELSKRRARDCAMGVLAKALGVSPRYADRCYGRYFEADNSDNNR